MKNLYIDAIRTFWFLAMAALICFCLLICAVAAWSCGATLDEVRQNTQEQFLRFVEGWSR